MTYKLLNKKGAHFVCLEDGTSLPCQVSATVQVMFEKCRVTVEALCDERLGKPDDPKLRLVNGVLTYGRHLLENVSDIEFKPGTPGEEGKIGTITFTINCELPDTIEQPKPYEA